MCLEGESAEQNNLHIPFIQTYELRDTKSIILIQDKEKNIGNISNAESKRRKRDTTSEGLCDYSRVRFSASSLNFLPSPFFLPTFFPIAAGPVHGTIFYDN